MGREIKFRYFSDFTSEMVLSDDLGLYAFFGEAHGTLMQYTGLKDNNGVEIYEGDIVGFDQGRIPNKQTQKEIWEVRFGDWCCDCGDYYCNESGTGFYLVGFSGLYRSNGSFDKSGTERGFSRVSGNWEVLGNIHENKDLLDEN